MKEVKIISETSEGLTFSVDGVSKTIPPMETTTFSSQNYNPSNITFTDKDNIVIGILSWGGGELSFTGNTDESAKNFLGFLADMSGNTLSIKSKQDVVVEPEPTVVDKSPKPTPIENVKSDRMSFFDGTSWDDGKRGHQF